MKKDNLEDELFDYNKVEEEHGKNLIFMICMLAIMIGVPLLIIYYVNHL